MRSEHRAPLVASIVVVLACIGVLTHAVRTDALGGIAGPIHRALLAAPVLHPKSAPTQAPVPATDVEVAAGDSRPESGAGSPGGQGGAASSAPDGTANRPDSADRSPGRPRGQHVGQEGPRQATAGGAPAAPAVPVGTTPVAPEPVAPEPAVPAAPATPDPGTVSTGQDGSGRSGHGWGRSEEGGGVRGPGSTTGHGVRDAVKSIIETRIATTIRDASGRGGGQPGIGIPSSPVSPVAPVNPGTPVIPSPPVIPGTPANPGRSGLVPGPMGDLVGGLVGGVVGGLVGPASPGHTDQDGGWGRGWR